jgi:hypothetical protein
MYAKDAGFLFPPRAAAALSQLRGEKWEQLVHHILPLPENDPDLLALNLMMIRLNSCLTCTSDSYRAMRGCTSCAQHTICRFRGSDDDLLLMWEVARAEVVTWLETGEPPLTD